MRSRPIRDGVCRLTDGRALGYAEWGVGDGIPVLAFHGTPGSRLWCPDPYEPGVTTTEAGVRFIVFDRPGYGISDPAPPRAVADIVADVEQLMDELGLDRCAMLGSSGGGPYAMAVAATRPERVTRLALVGSLSPMFHAPGVWDELPDAWRSALEAADRDPSAALELAHREAGWLVNSVESAGEPESWPEVDRWLARDPAMTEFLDMLREGGRQGTDGLAVDSLATNRPWGFAPGDIGVETWLWQGDLDEIVKPIHFHRLCDEIPDAHGVVVEGQGHLLRGCWGEIWGALTK